MDYPLVINMDNHLGCLTTILIIDALHRNKHNIYPPPIKPYTVAIILQPFPVPTSGNTNKYDF